MATETFGQWIQRKQKELGLTTNECAERSGMKAPVWSNWANDRTRRKDGKPTEPRKDTIEAIARGLGLPFAEVAEAAGYTGASRSEDNDQTDREAMRAIGQRMKEQRELLKLTQAQVADRCDPPMPRDTYAQYELGLNHVSAARLARIAKALECSVAYLMGEAEAPNAPIPASRIEETISRLLDEKLSLFGEGRRGSRPEKIELAT